MWQNRRLIATFKLQGKNLLLFSFIKKRNQQRRLPLYQQTEVALCGLVCLQMLLAYYGRYYHLFELQQQYPVGHRGLTLKTIAEIAMAEGFQYQAWALTVEEVLQLEAPLLLAWDRNHFVVLGGRSVEAFCIHDPAKGQYTLTRTAFEAHFRGIAMQCIPGAHFLPRALPPSTQKKMDWLVRDTFFKKTWFKILACLGIMQVAQLMSPWYVRWVVDQGMHHSWQYLLQGTGIAISIGIIGAWAAWRGRAYSQALKDHLTLGLVQPLKQRLLRLPGTFFENRWLWDLKYNFDAHALLPRVIQTKLELGLNLASGLLCGMMMAILCCPLFLGTSVILGIVLVFKHYQAAKLLQEQETAAQLQAGLQNQWLENVRNITTIQGLALEARRTERWLTDYYRALEAQNRYMLRFQKRAAWQLGVFALEQIIIVYAATYLLKMNALSLGTFFGYLTLRFQLQARALKGLDQYWELQQAQQAQTQLSTFYTTKPSDLAPQKIECAGPLQVTGLSYRYPSGGVLFNNLSFVVQPGQWLWVQGPSGCGKSTLLKLLLGTLPLQTGAITIAGHSLEHIAKGSVRYVGNEEALLQGSLRDNITGFETTVDSAWLAQVLQYTGLIAWVQSLPMGLETQILELNRGGLSTGQRQRVMLARALYGRPLVLLLDEVSTHWEAALQEQVFAALKALSVMVVIVSHQNCSHWADLQVVLQSDSTNLVPA